MNDTLESMIDFKQQLNNKKVYILLVLLSVTLILGLLFFVVFSSKNDNYSNQKDVSKKETIQSNNNEKKYDPNICWNKVTKEEFNGGLYWPDGCKGNPEAEMCTMVLVELSEEEVKQYNNWLNDGGKLSNLNSKCKDN